MIDADAYLKIMRVADRVLDDVLEEIAADAQRFAPVDTGRLRESIHITDDGGDERTITAEADYAVYVEEGTSKMAAQPFLRPALYQKRNLRRHEP